MFDRDIRHYHPTPRTLNEAFGPYSRLAAPAPRAPRLLVAAVWVAGVSLLFLAGALLAASL
ncbi:MAG: hypothetical protein EPN65_16620 [Pandoraea sp.]|uniref:hypothetical protein n=1 Tax=Pandoraea sp. TaxID=1883445 RepID=UPI0011F8ADA7|nr:hypothetical protein [Pandoraea sp.]TAM15937.1 MAG: hypothetical protein EPN65_16620 [Pandoraea sp.]